MHESILAKLGDARLNPRIRAICPTYFSAARRILVEKHGKGTILAKMPSASFKGAHVVVTVPPGGKTFRLEQVDAGSEDGMVLNEMEIES